MSNIYTYTNADKLYLLSAPGMWDVKEKDDAGAFIPAVFQNGASWSYDKEPVQSVFDDVGVVDEINTNQTVAISVASGQVLNPQLITLLSGGMFDYTVSAGSVETGVEQTKAAESWDFDQPFLLMDGASRVDYKTVKPTITEITNGTTPLVAGTDYSLAWLNGSGWAVVPRSGGVLTDNDVDIVITFNYTKTGKTVVTGGDNTLSVPLEMRFHTARRDGVPVTYWFKNVYSTGSIGHGFGAVETFEQITMDLTFTARVDTTLSSGKLFEITFDM